MTTFYVLFEKRRELTEDQRADENDYRLAEGLEALSGSYERLTYTVAPVAEFRSPHHEGGEPVAHVVLADGRLVPARSLPGFVRLTRLSSPPSESIVRPGDENPFVKRPNPWALV
jgi:hypothetical protein